MDGVDPAQTMLRPGTKDRFGSAFFRLSTDPFEDSGSLLPHTYTLCKWNVQIARLLVFPSLHVLTSQHFEKKMKKNVFFESSPS